MKGFVNIDGTQVRPSQIESFRTDYYNGGQTIVTTVRTLSGANLEMRGTTGRDLELAIDKANSEVAE